MCVWGELVGIITSSTGNHAQGVLLTAKKLMGGRGWWRWDGGCLQLEAVADGVGHWQAPVEIDKCQMESESQWVAPSAAGCRSQAAIFSLDDIVLCREAPLQARLPCCC